MNSDTQLVLVFSFLEDIAREQLIDQANVANPAERTNVRENMRQALEEVRSMITQLEQSNPSVTAIITKDNAERLVTVLDARVLCHVTEAMIVADCYQDYSAAADAMTRAVQAMPENAGVRASLAGYHMLAGDLEAARGAIERALLSIQIASKLRRALSR